MKEITIKVKYDTEAHKIKSVEIDGQEVAPLTRVPSAVWKVLRDSAHEHDKRGIDLLEWMD